MVPGVSIQNYDHWKEKDKEGARKSFDIEVWERRGFTVQMVNPPTSIYPNNKAVKGNSCDGRSASPTYFETLWSWHLSLLMVFCYLGLQFSLNLSCQKLMFLQSQVPTFPSFFFLCRIGRLNLTATLFQH